MQGFRGLAILCVLVAAPVGDAASPDAGSQRCAACHPKEVAGYAKSAMARALTPMQPGYTTTPAQPDATFEHAPSKTTFVVRSTADGMTQRLTNATESEEHKIDFVMGSGSHGFGYLIQIGDHIFQSPISYYTVKKIWDVAPGYEMSPHPDFSRAITQECLFCHSGKSLPIRDSVNRYEPGVFTAYGISCGRCHGDSEAHLKSPAPGSIINPAKLTGAARPSVCEQCHLLGEKRIANPGKSITDFKPGETLEAYYSTYIGARTTGEAIKAVSHAEQLALSLCARRSGDKLWCGTCHNPHDKPAEPAAYFRERCLTCHGPTSEKANAGSVAKANAGTVDQAHFEPGRDCIGCHMPKTRASDGGHTAFTDHRIGRPGKSAADGGPRDTLAAWREPEPSLRDRNLALALIADGLENGTPEEAVRGYRQLAPLEGQFGHDDAVEASLGGMLVRAKQYGEALKRFEKAASVRPAYPPYRLNVAMALLGLGREAEAKEQLEKTVALDPLFRPAVEVLAKLYRLDNQAEKAEQLMGGYLKAVGVNKK